jgi:hypothetical protein
VLHGAGSHSPVLLLQRWSALHEVLLHGATHLLDSSPVHEHGVSYSTQTLPFVQSVLVSQSRFGIKQAPQFGKLSPGAMHSWPTWHSDCERHSWEFFGGSE